MSLEDILKGIKSFVSTNSPVILTGLGVAGTVSTAILAAKAGYKHGVADAVGGVSDDPKQRLKECYKHYIPATSLGVVTITSIILANSVSTKRTAAMASIYSVTDSAFREYKSKVVETLGEKKEAEVRDKIAQDRVDKNPPPASMMLMGDNKVPCYDSLTGRYFESDIETIRKAQNNINAQCINSVYASQNDFYREVGLNPTPYGEEVGWTTDHKMDITFSSTIADNGKPCLVLDYDLQPTRDYYKGFGWRG